MSMNSFNEPKDMASVRLECKVCGARQTAFFKADEKLRVASASHACKECGEKGKFKLAKMVTHV